MRIDELFGRMRESLHAKVVYGEPYEKDGLTVIPAAVVVGGGGGGMGSRDGTVEGEGGGFGMIARPAGAFVIEGGTVRWQPAFDVTRLITAGAVVALALFRRLRRARRRRLAKAKQRG